MLQAKNLSRSYGEFRAVEDVSFEIDAGEIVGLLGHNGAGKTTIMKMLTGYLEPSAGEVLIGGRRVEAQAEAVQAELGYLPENLPVYPEMTVIDYLEYAASMRGVAAADRPAAVRDAAAATELTERAGSLISTLSRGYRQRVGVAQAIVHRPKYLILDEPTNGLDPQQTQQMRELIRSLARSATVILSTHIMQEVSAVCSRAIMLRSGAVVLDERLADLTTTRNLVVRTDADLGAMRAAIGGQVNEIDAIDGGYRLTVDEASESVCASIARALFEAGARISALTPVTRDLEAVFREANEEVDHAAL
ncbi:MAG: ABC transporter ATP-binding protein [Pseudomonadota bacterium]